jgi:hypothetical protein
MRVLLSRGRILSLVDFPAKVKAVAVWIPFLGLLIAYNYGHAKALLECCRNTFVRRTRDASPGTRWPRSGPRGSGSRCSGSTQPVPMLKRQTW